MTRTDHKTLMEALQTKELVLTNAEFYEFKRKLEEYAKQEVEE
uniref:Uncharacterized protein n=1 Tax=viral metagenome TaxID=1070528 RepID=A0A6H2A1E8_9ZZZZ